jgi:hypothetical protein
MKTITLEEGLDAAYSILKVVVGQIVGIARKHQDQKCPANEKMDKGTAFTGTWHIYEMELWDEDYFNMEVQAYIRIDPNNLGDFQFGLVSGCIYRWKTCCRWRKV